MAISSKCNSWEVPEFVEWTDFKDTYRELEYLAYLKDKMGGELGLKKKLRIN